MRKVLCTAAVLLAGLAGQASAASIKSPLVGLWKLDGVMLTDAANHTMMPMGEHPGGYLLYTKGGHIIIFQTGDSRVTPAGPAATDAEAGKLIATMVAIAGTYKMAGPGKFVVNIEDSWNQSLIGAPLPRDFKVSGKKLTVTFAAKGPTGQDMTDTVTAHRVE
jgi:hypothetical protein